MFVAQVPILNHWWQTETGHSITATCVGLDHSTSPPKYSAGMPFPGYDGRSQNMFPKTSRTAIALNCYVPSCSFHNGSGRLKRFSQK